MRINYTIDEERKREDIVKCINGELYYLGDYTYFLYTQLLKKDDEIERLNNVINELEKWVKEDKECFETQFYMGRCVNFQCILDKLQELKGSDKK